MRETAEVESRVPARAVIGLDGLSAFVDRLVAAGRTVVAPTVRDGAIVPAVVTSADALPVGWGDEQEAGSYRLRRRDDGARFGYTVGPQSWRRYLTPTRELLFRARRTPEGFTVDDRDVEEPSYAFLGVRPCELAALAVQDRVQLGAGPVDPGYARRRGDAIVIAVECGDPAATCFCTSMGTGPSAGPGADLVLTEILDGDQRFLADRGE